MGRLRDIWFLSSVLFTLNSNRSENLKLPEANSFSAKNFVRDEGRNFLPRSKLIVQHRFTISS
jgi:hypothetical protein